jgi:hypothetical protein
MLTLASLSSTPILVVVIVLMVALLIGLAYFMSRASKLKPHRPGVTGNRWGMRRRWWQAEAERETRRRTGQE